MVHRNFYRKLKSEEIKTFIIAGFNIKVEKSIVYAKRTTLRGFFSALEQAINTKDLDYISIRLIRSDDLKSKDAKDLTKFIQAKEDQELRK